MLEIGACMEMKAKTSSLLESEDADFSDISFEELLAQEKKDAFWFVLIIDLNFLVVFSKMIVGFYNCSSFSGRKTGSLNHARDERRWWGGTNHI